MRSDLQVTDSQQASRAFVKPVQIDPNVRLQPPLSRGHWHKFLILLPVDCKGQASRADDPRKILDPESPRHGPEEGFTIIEVKVAFSGVGHHHRDDLSLSNSLPESSRHLKTLLNCEFIEKTSIIGSYVFVYFFHGSKPCAKWWITLPIWLDSIQVITWSLQFRFRS